MPVQDDEGKRLTSRFSMLTVFTAHAPKNRLAQCFVEFPGSLKLGALRRSRKVQIWWQTGEMVLHGEEGLLPITFL